VKSRAWILGGCLGALACRHAEAPEAEAKPLVTVKVATAALADVDLAVTAPATVFARERASISSSITAPIRALHARKGDRVSKGQVLAVLEDRDLVAQKAEAVAALRQAEVQKRRRSELFAQGAIPQRELLAAETDLLQSRARLEKVEAQIRFTELRSPFAGVIVEQQLYAGDMVRADTPVFTVVDMAVAIARAQVPEAEIEAVEVGQRGQFSTGAGATYAGRITMVNQAVDPARRTVEVWCEIPNPEGALRDGAFGHLNILTATHPKRVVVPKAAVQLAEGGTAGTVMVVERGDGKGKGMTAHKREVQTAGLVDDRFAIAKGLAAGETVVVEGGYGLPEGSEVRLAGDDAK
jgi:RND family efflux transporter MFP subunit